MHLQQGVICNRPSKSIVHKDWISRRCMRTDAKEDSKWVRANNACTLAGSTNAHAYVTCRLWASQSGHA